MRTLLGDLRLGLRTLGKTPGPALVAILALALGIGMTTTMFSIVYGALLRGLPYPGADRVMVVYRSNPSRGINRQSVSIQDLVDYREQQRSFAVLGAYTSGTVNVSGTEGAERFSGSWMTADAFRVVGVPPFLGRVFREGEDAPDGGHVVVLSYGLWSDRYGADPNVLGRSIRVNGEPYSVIGVMPEDFEFPQDSRLWLPLQTDPLVGERGQGQYVSVVGRLKPGVSRARAAADISGIAQRLAAQYPESDGGSDATVTSFVDWSIGPQPRRLLYTMLGAVFCVLLIACANVANLLLDRAAHRMKEVGIRTALGASRWQILRQFLTEAAVLAAGGVVVGIAVAWLGVAAFNRALVGTEIPFFIRIALFPPVLAFAVGAGLVATLASGALPALQSSRTDINEVLKDESRGASGLRVGRMSKGLVMLEVALSCTLLVAAGLMVKSVTRMRGMDPGFTTADVFTARVGFPAPYTDTTRERAFFRQLEEKVAAMPGVRAASISSGLPGARQGLGGNRFSLDGSTYANDLDYPVTRTLSATPGIFATLGIQATRGRLFTEADREGSEPVAVVTQRFADRFLSGGDPLGRRIRLGASKSTAPWLRIVGVVPDFFGGDPEDPHPAVVIQPFAQAFQNFVYISARTSGPPMALTSQVRDAAATLEADIPLYWVMSLDQAIAEPLWFVRVFGTMFMIFGFVALFLAAVGLYAVMAFSVSRRTREVGIRMALGAPGRRVVRMILGQGLTQLAIGMAVGLAGALAVSRLLVVILFDVQPRDPLVFFGVVVTLVLTGTLATGVPALRATGVDPVEALRVD